MTLKRAVELQPVDPLEELEPIPVEEWLRVQDRFRHLFETFDRCLLREIQVQVDEDWDELLRRCEHVELSAS